ncbi:fibronectin type III domain-containing protein [Candidatus Methanoliparum sp. LAM-1]|nr:fibronectin type III domain-containing protein [Candidatus Methanoliparum sp. LAM-1]BDC35959.1 hypothetical protein MTLP_06410 [Candidatus Methanoliparum sp. LAM-1]
MERYIGSYPFKSQESAYDYKRFRTSTSINEGRATIPVGYLLQEGHNSEDWSYWGTIAIRFELYGEMANKDRQLGTYDIFVSFIKDSAGNFLKLPSIVEGPFVNMVRSDEPTSVLISFKTIEEGIGKAVVGNKEYEESAARKNHEIKIEGLMPDTKYYYYVSFNGVPSPVCSFRTAPKKGDGEVVFAYTGDRRF